MKLFRNIALVVLCAILSSCKQPEGDLQYYTAPNHYEVVSVTPPPADAEVRNVILMIGDGMGLEQISCAWVLNRGKLNIDNFPVVGLSRTYCTNKLITDSAAGGTALAVGQKTAIDHVGCDPDGAPLYSMLSKAQELGKKTGRLRRPYCRLYRLRSRFHSRRRTRLLWPQKARRT